MEKKLENPKKIKRRKQPKPAQLGPARPRAPRDRRTPPVSGSSPLPPARSLSHSLPNGADLSAPISFTCALPLSLSRGPSSPVAESLPRAPPFLSLRRGPALSVPPSPLSPDFSTTTPTHAPSSLLRAPSVPRARPLPHFAQLHPLSRSAHATSRRRRPAPAFPATQLTGDRSKPPRASPRGETPVPVPNFPYCAMCSANFTFAGARPRRSAVLARWPAD
jgi:hypothetical protein